MASVDHGVPKAVGSPVALIRDVFGACFLSQEQGHWGKGMRIVTGTQVSSRLEVVTWLGQAPGQGPRILLSTYSLNCHELYFNNKVTPIFHYPVRTVGV